MAPTERPWRHPSELASDWPDGPAVPPGPAGGPRPVPGAVADAGHGRRRTIATALVGAGAAAAVIVGVTLLLTTGSDVSTDDLASGTGPGTVSTLATAAICCRSVPPDARATARAMVSLEVSSPHGTSGPAGWWWDRGGWLPPPWTRWPAPGRSPPSARRAWSSRPGWRHVDRSSDIALVQVSANLPVAPFADDADAAAGQGATMMALTTSGGPRQGSVATWEHGTIESVTAPVVGGDAGGDGRHRRHRTVGAVDGR